MVRTDLFYASAFAIPALILGSAAIYNYRVKPPASVSKAELDGWWRGNTPWMVNGLGVWLFITYHRGKTK